jgi:hypothetical protein
LAHLGWRPILLTGLLRDLVTRHFASSDLIEEPDLQDLLWKPGADTDILVESVHRWRGQLVEKRPAVIIKRQGYRSHRQTINDFHASDREGHSHYGILWVGSHTLFCIHGEGAATEILATEVQRELTQMAPGIRNSLGLHKFQVTQVGAIGQLEEASENFVVPITVGWAYEETWQLTRTTLPMQGVELEINAHDC